MDLLVHMGVILNKDEALRLALEALKNAYWPIDSNLLPAHNIKECAEAITAIKAALEAKDEPEQMAKLGWQVIDCPICGGGARAFPKQEAKDEPWEKFCDSNCVWTDHHPDCKLAQRTWVGLTLTEIELLFIEHTTPKSTAIDFARAIESKFKEKNG
jgi:hypothetical protein